MKTNKILAVLAISFMGFGLNSCLTQSSFGTAKMLKAGQIDVSPSYGGNILFGTLPEKLDIDKQWQNNFGLNIGSGVSRKFNLNIYYQHSTFPLASSNLKFNYFQLEPKLELERIRHAISFPIGVGFLDDANLFQIGIRGFSNYYFNRNLFYCFSPSAAVVAITEVDTGFELAFLFNNILNIQLYNTLYLRPAVGIELTSTLYAAVAKELLLNTNYGIAIGKEF